MSRLSAVKLTNYNVVLKVFVLLLTFSCVICCSPKRLAITRVEGKQIGVTDANGEDPNVAAFIKPYREHIEADMNTVLATAPVTIDKSGQWQTPIGDFFADVTLAKTEPVFFAREQKHIDFCLLNAGGVRSILPAGNVTMKNAYEIMPFENACIVVEMRPSDILEMIGYIISEKKPHPLSGLNFTIGKDGRPKNIFIGGKPFDQTRNYYCVTSDYLYVGGDNMTFFGKGPNAYRLEYKLRNVLIDYFKDVEVVTAPKNERITVEK